VTAAGAVLATMLREVVAMRVRALASLPLALLLAFLLAGCRGYYPSWHYRPGSELHEIHLPGDTEGRATIQAAARLVGILRPVEGGPRRLHAHLSIENRGAAPATIDPSKASATPSGAAALAPEAGGAVTIGPAERRDVEIYFVLPDPAALPNASLEEIDLAWTIAVGERSLTTHATFRRGSSYRDDPYGYDPWYPGPYWRHHWGPYWTIGSGFSVVHCR